MLSGLPLPALGGIFIVAAALVWVASTHLSTSTDLLADRWHLGQALAGLLLLATVEDLPEVVIVVTGALKGHLGLITGNLLGGIAAQTLILAAIDAAGVSERPLTYRAASLQMVLVGLQGVTIFGIVIMSTQLPGSVHALRLDPGSVLIFLVWVLTSWLLNRARGHLPWTQSSRAADPPRVEAAKERGKAEDRAMSTGRAIAIFAASAAGIVIGGYALEESGSQLAGGIGLSGIVFGATVLALSTSLPEFATGYTLARRGDFELAVSEVFGSNTFLPVLFLPAAVISGTAVLSQAGPAEIYLTGAGILLTVIYLWGLLFRPARQHFRLGPDSIVVVIVYVVTIAGLFAVVNG